MKFESKAHAVFQMSQLWNICNNLNNHYILMSDLSLCEQLWEQYQALKKNRVAVIKQTQQKLRDLQKQSVKQCQAVSRIANLYENTDLVQTLHNIIVNGLTENNRNARGSHNNKNLQSIDRDKSKQYLRHSQFTNNIQAKHQLDSNSNISHRPKKQDSSVIEQQPTRRELGSIKVHNRDQKVIASKSNKNIRLPDFQPEQQKDVKNPYKLVKPIQSPITKEGAKLQHNTSEQSLNLTRRAQLNKLSLS